MSAPFLQLVQDEQAAPDNTAVRQPAPTWLKVVIAAALLFGAVVVAGFVGHGLRLKAQLAKGPGYR